MRLCITIALTTLFTIIGLACGGQPEPPATVALTTTPTATPEPTFTPPTPTASPTPLPTATPQSAATILEVASAAMKKLDSLHFDMEMEVTEEAPDRSSDFPFTYMFTSVGDVQAPDRSKGTTSASLLGFSIESEFVIIGETSYVTNPETGEWEISSEELLPIGDPIDLLDFDAFELEGLQLLGEEFLYGIAVYHLSGLTTSNVFGDEEDDGQDLMIDFWISIEDSFVMQIAVRSEIEPEDDDDSLFADGMVNLSQTLKFSDFGKPVVIEAPEVKPAPPCGRGLAITPLLAFAPPGPPSLLPLVTAVLTLDDFPAGFEEVSPAELGFEEGATLLDNLIIKSSFAFANADPFELVFGFTLAIPALWEQIGFDLALSQPEFLLGCVVSRIVEEGTEIKEQVTLPGLDGFGEKSAGMTVAFDSEGIPFRMEIVGFRKGRLGVFVATKHFDGDTPIVPIEEAVRNFDDRIAEVSFAEENRLMVALFGDIFTINTSSMAIITMENGGDIVIELFDDEVPITVDNFVSLARDGYYDGITFHSVIPGFMAQTGDPTGTGSGGPGYEFDNEFHPDLRHDGPGIVSMANTGIRDGRGTNGSQFFITYSETLFLDGLNPDGSPKDCAAPGVSCHAVFGRVTGGMDVVEGITPRDPQTATTPGDVIKTIKIFD